MSVIDVNCCLMMSNPRQINQHRLTTNSVGLACEHD